MNERPRHMNWFNGENLDDELKITYFVATRVTEAMVGLEFTMNLPNTKLTVVKTVITAIKKPNS